MSEKPTHLHTRLIVTLGPKSGNEAMMRALIQAGVQIFRNNFAHCPYEEYRERQRVVEELNKELGTSVLMLADLQGQSIRLGELPNGGIFLKAGEHYAFRTLGSELKEGEILINDDSLHQLAQPGDPVSFIEGALEGEVVKVQGNRIVVSMSTSGLLKSRKSIEIPHLNGSPLTAKDRKDLNFLIHDAGVDWIALPLGSGKKELKEIRDLIVDRSVRLIYTADGRASQQTTQEMIQLSDGVLLARHNLALNKSFADIPFLYKKILGFSHHAEKPVFASSPFLASLIYTKKPATQEVAEVAEAVSDKVDALLVPEEVTESNDPIAALNIFITILERAEHSLFGRVAL